MTKRSKKDKEREEIYMQEFEANPGKTASFKYHTRTGEDKFSTKLVVGKIGKLERDFTNSHYGHAIHMEKITEQEEEKALENIPSNGYGEMNIIGEEKSANYKEKYYLRRISELTIN
jgi:hypothetical protein